MKEERVILLEDSLYDFRLHSNGQKYRMRIKEADILETKMRSRLSADIFCTFQAPKLQLFLPQKPLVL